MRSAVPGFLALFDPEAATDAAFNRRVFVGLGTGAAFAGTASAALAANDGFGKPHPPIVAEDDPAIGVFRPKLPTGISAYAAAPKTATHATPGVVIVQHIWGVDATIRDDVRRLAKEGYVTIAPELFDRDHPPSGDGADDYTIFLPFAQKLESKQVDADLAAGATWIRSRAGSSADARPPKVGVIGFCMGGRIALSQAWRNPHPFDAAAIFYGSVAEQRAHDVRIPVIGSYGARDTGIPAPDVRAFFAALKPPHDVKIYDEAGHAFFDDTRESYVPSAASDAWTRTLRFFRKYLSA